MNRLSIPGKVRTRVDAGRVGALRDPRDRGGVRRSHVPVHARLERRNRVELPASYELIDHPVDAGQKPFAASKRQLIQKAGHKPLANVEIGRAVVQLKVRRIEVRCAVRSGRIGVDRVGPAIGGEQRKARGESPLQLEIERVEG